MSNAFIAKYNRWYTPEFFLDHASDVLVTIIERNTNDVESAKDYAEFTLTVLANETFRKIMRGEEIGLSYDTTLEDALFQVTQDVLSSLIDDETAKMTDEECYEAWEFITQKCLGDKFVKMVEDSYQ